MEPEEILKHPLMLALVAERPEFLRELSGIARPQCVSEGGRVAELATVC
jgi:hypothetical protein